MPRTTADLVAGILEADGDIALDPFITAASLLVDLIPAGKLATSPTDTYQVIETWLAAHFYCMRDPRAVTEKAGDITATYETKINFCLYLSKYGQMAVTLDTTGTLRAISDGKRKPKLVWMGQDLSTLR